MSYTKHTINKNTMPVELNFMNIIMKMAFTFFICQAISAASLCSIHFCGHTESWNESVSFPSLNRPGLKYTSVMFYKHNNIVLGKYLSL